MSDGPKPGPFNINAAMEELLEAQRKVDEVAKNTVDGVKRLIEVRENLVPGANATFEQLYGAWYRSVEDGLAALGFQSFGQYKDLNKKSGTPPENDAYYHLALSADRTITAGWFLIAAKEPRRCLVLESIATDGAVITTSCGTTESSLPLPPNRDVERFPADTPAAQLVADHRAHVARTNKTMRELAGIDDLLADRLRQATEQAAYRRQIGLGMFEPYLRALSRGHFEEKGKPVLESILAHPEWWTGEAPTAQAIRVPDRLHINFLMSSEEQAKDRRHITTVGLAPLGLPELQMRGLAANHCRAGRALLHASARKLVEYAAKLPASGQPIEERLAGIELLVTRDAIADLRGQPYGPVSDRNGNAPVTVRLELEDFGGTLGQALDAFSVLLRRKRAARLLTIVSSSNAADVDEWLRESCARLGLAVPAARPSSAFREAMDAASRYAVAELPELRARLNAGLPDGQLAAIKIGLDSTTGSNEYVWVRVTEWPAGEFAGKLAVQPRNCPGYTLGQPVRVADSDVFDRAIFSNTEGAIQPSLTDVVAMDFGVDLAG
jgi:hypothetical protein